MMRLEIKGLQELRARLDATRAEAAMQSALARQAERMAAAVRDGLSQPPGSGAHDRPWQQSGALRDSVGVVADGLEAVVGSSDPAAAPQEMGTIKMAARPFLAPVAADKGEEIARGIGRAVAAVLGGEEASGSEAQAGLAESDV